MSKPLAESPRETETSAESITHVAEATAAIGALALATVQQDPQRAVHWLEKVKDGAYHQQRDGEVALRLIKERPDLAEQIWNFALTSRNNADRRIPPRLSLFLADYCYRLASVDVAQADRLAGTLGQAALRLRARGAIALALAESDPNSARRRLELLVRDDIVRLSRDESLWFRSSWSAPTTAAWLLPIAERVAPDLCREIMWRSLALRLPRPRRDHFDDEVETTDLELAKMLARYDRDLARHLLEPLAEPIEQWMLPGTTALKSPHASEAAQSATRWARDLVVAACRLRTAVDVSAVGQESPPRPRLWAKRSP